MVSSEEFLEYVQERLSALDDVGYRPMMGEYVLYAHGRVVGGIYDDRLLLKPTRRLLKLTRLLLKLIRLQPKQSCVV